MILMGKTVRHKWVNKVLLQQMNIIVDGVEAEAWVSQRIFGYVTLQYYDELRHRHHY